MTNSKFKYAKLTKLSNPELVLVTLFRDKTEGCINIDTDFVNTAIEASGQASDVFSETEIDSESDCMAVIGLELLLDASSVNETSGSFQVAHVSNSTQDDGSVGEVWDW